MSIAEEGNVRALEPLYGSGMGDVSSSCGVGDGGGARGVGCSCEVVFGAGCCGEEAIGASCCCEAVFGSGCCGEEAIGASSCRGMGAVSSCGVGDGGGARGNEKCREGVFGAGSCGAGVLGADSTPCDCCFERTRTAFSITANRFKICVCVARILV